MAARGIGWPRHDDGKLDLRRQTFKRMRAVGPEIERLYRLRHDLSELRRFTPAVGADNRNRADAAPVDSAVSRESVFLLNNLFLIAAVLSGYLVVNGVTGVPGTLLQRRFALRRWLVEPFAALLFGLGSGLGLAFGLGAWGLVIGWYASTVFRAIVENP